MASDELSATTDVVTLAEHTDGFGTNVAGRLEDAGIETVADILIADESALTDVPYVSDLRAGTLRKAAQAAAGDDDSTPGPRAVDFDATDSVVSAATIPLSVRRGEDVFVGGTRSEVYHTRDCSIVRSHDLEPMPKERADKKDLSECPACQNPEYYSEKGMGGSVESDLEPLADSREVVLEATVGEKLSLTMAERNGYSSEWAVIDTEEPTTSETAAGDSWQTRRIRISQKMNGKEHTSECDLVVAADEIRIEDPPVKRRSAQPNAPSWRLESVRAVGRVSRATHAQLQGRLQQRDAKPEGDDTWRKYKRGETA